MRSPIIGIIVLVIGVGGVVGYLKTRGKIDTKDADNQIKTLIETRVAPVDKVECPEASRKKGSKFECKVAFTGGKSYQLRVEITGDEGEWTPDWVTPIAGAEKLAADITTSFSSQVKNLVVDCGKGVVEIPKDGYLCSATDEKGKGHFRVKFDDKTKNIVWAPES